MLFFNLYKSAICVKHTDVYATINEPKLIEILIAIIDREPEDVGFRFIM